MSINRQFRSAVIATITTLGLSLPAAGIAESELFRQLLNESDLRLAAMDGFSQAELQPNPVVSYEHAVRSEAGDVEVRYLIRPLGRIVIDYDDPHNAAPEPNHLFPMLYESLVGNLAARGTYFKNDYSASDARKFFNADLASATLLDVDPSFATDNSQALVIGIHKDNLADAYIVILFDDYETSKDAIRRATESLAFES